MHQSKQITDNKLKNKSNCSSSTFYKALHDKTFKTNSYKIQSKMNYQKEHQLLASNKPNISLLKNINNDSIKQRSSVHKKTGNNLPNKKSVFNKKILFKDLTDLCSRQHQKINDNQYSKHTKILHLMEEQLPKFKDVDQKTDHKILDKYQFDILITHHTQLIKQIVYTQQCNFVSVEIYPVCCHQKCLTDNSKVQENTSITQNNHKNKSIFPIILEYVQHLLPKNNEKYKNFISIYMINLQTKQILDMLSIRRQKRNTINDLVKTYISNTKKSHLIVKKLVDFAQQRQIINYQEGIRGKIFVRLQLQKIVQETNKESQKQNCYHKQQIDKKQDNTKIVVQICLNDQISYSPTFIHQLPQKSHLFKIHRIIENCKYQHLEQFTRKNNNKEANNNKTICYEKETDEKKLLQYIDSLYSQLEQNRKQIELYKQKVETLEQDDEEVDIVLPSERIAINADKFKKMQNYATVFNLHPQPLKKS